MLRELFKDAEHLPGMDARADQFHDDARAVEAEQPSPSSAGNASEFFHAMRFITLMLWTSLGVQAWSSDSQAPRVFL